MLPRVKTAALSLLRQGRTMDKYDVADTVFCHPKTAQRALSFLHGEGKAHVIGWRVYLLRIESRCMRYPYRFIVLHAQI